MSILLFTGVFVGGLVALAEAEKCSPHSGWANRKEQEQFDLQRQQWRDNAMFGIP